MRFLVILALSLASTVAGAQLYSWKDASGKVHYSDEPPPDKSPSRKVAAPPAPSADPAAVRRSLAEKEIESRKKQKESQESAAKAEKAKTEAAERRVDCERAKGNLGSIESGQTRFATDSKGERVALDGAVREAELASARKAVDALCK